jgi:hypothetical protein
MQDLLIGFFAGAGTVVGGIFTIRELYGWLRPIKIHPSVKIRRADIGPDQVLAVIVNRSRDPVYIVKCRARSAHPLKHALRTHIKHPFVRPRMLETIYYGPHIYEMTDEASIKLDPDEPLFLTRDMVFKNPIFTVPTPMLAIEVVLSSGKKIRSQRFEIPERWTMHRHLRKQEP